LSDVVPSARQLLDLAREVLVRDLVPLLPEERRVDALMAAQAIVIAAREGAELTAAADAARLAAEIRAGTYDAPGEARERARGELWRMTRHALAIVNPALLAAHGLD
jgi:hypothetical protein